MSSHVRDLHKRPGPSEFEPPPNGRPANNSERYAEERRRMFEDETSSGAGAGQR